jgi:hypothetical protein
VIHNIKGGAVMHIKSLGEAIDIYLCHKIIDLKTELGQELEAFFKASSYTITYYGECAFIPALDHC